MRPSSRSQAGKKPAENPRHRWRWAWWGGLGIVVLAAVLGTNLTRPVVQIGLPSLLIVAFVHWRVRRFLRRSEPKEATPIWLRIAQKMWRPRGSGFYALIAAATFLGLQGELLLSRGREVWGTWRAAPYTDGGAFVDFLSSQLWGGFIEVLVAVSLGTILNVVWAGLWPLSWMLRYDILTAAGAMILAYAVYRVARARLPVLDAVMQHVEGPAEAEPGPEAPEAGTGPEKMPEARRHDPSTERH